MAHSNKSILLRAKKFPIGDSITLNVLATNLHATLHQLRQSEPVSWLPVIQAWVVTRHDLTIEVMRDAKTYTVDHPAFSTGQVVGTSMLSLDGSAHQRHRQPFERPFRKSAVRNRFNPIVANHINQLLDGIVGQGEAELRRDFAGPVAVKTMVSALGLADTSVTAVLGWYDTIVEAVTRVTAGEPVSKAGRQAFAALRDSLLPSLRSKPETSLLAAASGMADGLSDDEIVSNAAVLLFGGIETTEGMIANAFYHLLSDKKVLEMARESKGKMDTRLKAFIEESLRLEPAAAVVDRYTTCDVQLGSADISAGELVQVSLAGANRDPAVFITPDRFDPTRPNLRSHVTFAQGPHVCLGIHLARLEAQLALEQALHRLPNLQLVGSSMAQQKAIPTGLIFRKPQALHVVFENKF